LNEPDTRQKEMSKLRARMVIPKMIENGGKSLSQAMIDVGYSRGYAHNPHKWDRTKTAKQCLEEYLPDELIHKRHEELVNAGYLQHYYFPKPAPEKVRQGKKWMMVEKNELTNEEIREIIESQDGCRLTYVKRDYGGAFAYFTAPDSKARKDGIDMAYKRKGSYAPEELDVKMRKYQELSDVELSTVIKKAKEKLIRK
jgi:hypothetical protein